MNTASLLTSIIIFYNIKYVILTFIINLKLIQRYDLNI